MKLRDGREVTLRVGSLRVRMARAAGSESREGEKAEGGDRWSGGEGEMEALVVELRKLRVELAGVKEVLGGIEGLMAGEAGWRG